MKHFGDIAFTDLVKAEQARHGSRETYAAMTARAPKDGLGEHELSFITARDSFYMASTNSDGWPYVQHRGGPRGFLKGLDGRTIGFADYSGNRQYVSVGNLGGDNRVSLFLMDYPNRARLKILGRSKILAPDAEPDLAAKLATTGEGPIERLFLIEVEAFDWNCPKYITPRYTVDELAPQLQQVSAEIEALKQENIFLKQEMARVLKGRSGD